MTLCVLAKKVISPKWKNKARAVYLCCVGHDSRVASVGKEEVEHLWAELQDINVKMEPMEGATVEFVPRFTVNYCSSNEIIYPAR